jgi:hypothetical protein
MNKAQFSKFVLRDAGCYHCGKTYAIAPNHRANRGMGGSKERDTPSNIVVLCSYMNGLIESDPRMAQMAREYGWKLRSWEDPLVEPVFDFQTGMWYVLNDDYTRQVFIEGKHDTN